MKSKSPEQWRKYFESGNCSIYQIIFHAIRVAALDDPEEFKLRRKQIVQRLYSCQFTGCCCCVDQTELDVHSTVTQVFKDCKKTCASINVLHSEVRGGSGTDQADELGNNIEDDRDNICHVLQIKEELENGDELTETEIYESLRKLQLMVQSVDVLEVTKIGSTVSDLQQHWSRQISILARSIADGWKSMIVELVDTAAETAEMSKKPEPNFVLEEWREFPSAEFVPQPPVEFSEKFLDDMDDDENAGVKGNNEIEERQRNAAMERLQEPIKREKAKQESVQKLINCRYNRPSNKSHSEVEKIRRMEGNPPMGNKRKLGMQLMKDAEFITPIKRQKVMPQGQESIHQEPTYSAPNPRPPKSEHTSDRIPKPRVEKEAQNHKSEIRNKHTAQIPNINTGLKNSLRSSDNTAMEEKLETTKKKLQAGYQAHERARRSTQLIPERDLLKKASSRRSSRFNFKNQTRIRGQKYWL